MARHWRCVVRRHDWREVKTPDGDKYAECTRCGKHDWRRVVPRHISTKWRGGDMPPGGASY
jgi:hypothetical protein